MAERGLHPLVRVIHNPSLPHLCTPSLRVREYLNVATNWFPSVLRGMFGVIGLVFLSNPLHKGVSGAMARA